MVDYIGISKFLAIFEYCSVWAFDWLTCLQIDNTRHFLHHKLIEFFNSQAVNGWNGWRDQIIELWCTVETQWRDAPNKFRVSSISGLGLWSICPICAWTAARCLWGTPASGTRNFNFLINWNYNDYCLVGPLFVYGNLFLKIYSKFGSSQFITEQFTSIWSESLV